MADGRITQQAMTPQKNFPSILFILAVALLASLLILGIAPLRVGNINWLFVSNPDPLTHYLGWAFYRQSEWAFPVGLNPSYGLEIGSSIVFSDSIPLFAIFFKLFGPLLPETFQYFGIWYLFCLVLQGWFGWKITSLISPDIWIKTFGLLLAIFSPPMLSRIGLHAALVGHFLILAAFYLIFCPNKKRFNLYWSLLLAVGALVQFYLFAMLLTLWIASRLDKVVISKAVLTRNLILTLIATAIFILFILWQAGYFAITASSANEFGFGLYRMNLLSIFNPRNNYADSSWSYLLPALPEPNSLYLNSNTRLSEGSHEGFNFLGLGVIGLIPFAVFGAAKQFSFCKRQVSENLFLFICLLLLWIFALSNNASIGALNFHYEIPAQLIPLLSIFRCSGRMFWPVFYSIIFIQIVIVVRAYPAKFARFILGICCLIQLADTSAGWMALETRLQQNSKITPTNLLINPFWGSAAKHFNSIRVEPLINGQFQARWEHLAPFAVKNHLGTNAVYLARIDQIKLNSANIAFETQLSTRELNQQSLYVLDDSKILPALLNMDRQNDLLAKIDNFVVLAPGWKACKSCLQVPEGLEINKKILRPPVGKAIKFNATNPNLKLLLAGGHGWLDSSHEGVSTKDIEAKMALPMPDGVNAQYVTLAFRKIGESSNYPSFSMNGAAINVKINEMNGETLFQLPISARASMQGYVPIEISTKNKAVELKSATFN
jgi:Family of unknown function (DUF6311)